MVQQRKRAHKVSNGVNGAKKHPLTEGQKVLLGRGLYQALEVIDTRPIHRRGKPWWK